MMTDLEKDERVNIVGKALINDLVFDAIRFDNRKFRFLIVGEYDFK